MTNQVDPTDPMLSQAWEVARTLPPESAEIMRKLCTRLRDNDRILGQTIDDRDRYHEVADDLAQAIAKHLGIDIGEHSTANCPWVRALDAIAECPAAHQQLTEEQHIAAVKVLLRANGLDGLPQRMVDAMKAVA